MVDVTLNDVLRKLGQEASTAMVAQERLAEAQRDLEATRQMVNDANEERDDAVKRYDLAVQILKDMGDLISEFEDNWEETPENTVDYRNFLDLLAAFDRKWPGIQRMTDLVTTGTPLDRLDPRQRLALDFYTNPLYGKTFGNKAASARAAGYETVDPMHSKMMADAIAWVLEQKEANSEQVSAFLTTFVMDAARKLVQQLGADEQIEVREIPEELLVPPKPVMGQDKDGNDRIVGWDDGHLKVVDRITAQNRAAASLMKESREALKLVLAYHMGTPEQKIRNERREDESDPLNLGDLSDEQLKELARHVEEVREMKASVRVLPAPQEEEV